MGCPPSHHEADAPPADQEAHPQARAHPPTKPPTNKPTKKPVNKPPSDDDDDYRYDDDYYYSDDDDCKDDSGFAFGKPWKDCDWVGGRPNKQKKKLCTIRKWLGKLISEYCPDACGKCK